MKWLRSSKGDPELAHIPVLLLTGAFEPIDEARARAVGCDGVLVKPFEPQMVISRVRDLLAGKREAGPGGRAAHAVAPPASGAPPAEPASSLEDYFDRLDAALASKGASVPILDPLPAAPVPGTLPRPGLTVVQAVPDTRAPLADMDLTGWNPPSAPKPRRERHARDAGSPAAGAADRHSSESGAPRERRQRAHPLELPERRESGSGLCRPARRRAGAGAISVHHGASSPRPASGPPFCPTPCPMP